MSWLALILLSVVTYSFSVILQKYILNNSQKDPVVFSLLFQIITGIIIALYSLITGQMKWLPIGGLMPNALLMTALYGIGNMLLFKALQVIDASKFTILFASRGLFTVIASSLILKELLTTNQLFGALLILIGIIIVNSSKHASRLEKHDWYAILAALMFGVANTNDRILLSQMNLYQFVFLSFVLSGLFTGILYYRRLTVVTEYFSQGFWKKMIVLTSVYAISAVLFFASLQSAPNSSQVAVINLTSTIVIAVLGITLLREKSNLWYKLGGALISFVGLILITR